MRQPEPPVRSRIGTLASLFGAAITLAWRRYEVAEHSMRPTLDDGDWIVATRHPAPVRPGDVVVGDHPDRPGFTIVKRVAAVDPSDGSLWLVGDDPSAGSIDSRAFGSVHPSAVEARVLLRYRPWPPRLIR